MKISMDRWILVSEYTPSIDGYYLITICRKYVKNTLVKYSKFEVENVITWMNLPIPYNF